MAEHLNDYGIPHHPERFQDVTNRLREVGRDASVTVEAVVQPAAVDAAELNGAMGR